MTPSFRQASLAGLAAAAAGFALAAPAAQANPWYSPPTDLPSENGQLIKSQPMKLGVTWFDLGQLRKVPGTATRIMYKSTDANGQPVAVTGAYIEPAKAWNGPGARPLVAYAEGTQGQADSCAPSRTLESTLNVKLGAIGLGYEVPNIYNLLNKGMAVVVTDYIGLGTPDRLHTYVDRRDMAHAVLDSARAALQLTNTSVTAQSPVGSYGYSQGGGASAAAAELAPTYAPDVNYKAGFGGAPPANLLEVLRTADGTSLTGVLGYAINGILANNPQLQPVFDAKTNAAGKAALKKTANQCIGDSLTNFAFRKTSEWTNSRKSAYQEVLTLPDVLQVVDQQRIGKIKPEIPFQITVGTKDDIVGFQQAKQLGIDWCRLGANLRFTTVNQALSSFGTSLNHLGPMITAGNGAANWLYDRLTTNVPNASNCAQLGVS